MHCEICGKTTSFAKRVAHDRMYVTGRSSRKVKPNLHRTTIGTDGGTHRVTACTRCMRTMRKQNKA